MGVRRAPPPVHRPAPILKKGAFRLHCATSASAQCAYLLGAQRAWVFPSTACTECARAAGIASDPQKIARYRAALRMRRALPERTLRTPALKNFTRMLLKARCERTCRAAWRLPR